MLPAAMSWLPAARMLAVCFRQAPFGPEIEPGDLELSRAGPGYWASAGATATNRRPRAPRSGRGQDRKPQWHDSRMKAARG